MAAAVVFGAGLVACNRAGGSPVTDASHPKARTVVSIEFDDGTASQWTARRLLSAQHVKATFFVVSGAVGTPGYLTWRQVRALAADGNEIAGHTVTHPHLAALSGDEATREVCGGRKALIDRGFAVSDLAYPYGSYTAATEAIAAACGFNSARTIAGPDPNECATCAHAESLRPVDPYATKGGGPAVATTDLTILQSYVTDAETHGGGWVQVFFHRLCDGCDAFSTPPALLEAFLQWLAPRAPAGTVVRTVHQVIGGPRRSVVAPPPPPPPVTAGRNGLVNPSLEVDADHDGVPDCWTETGYGSNTFSWSRAEDAHGGSSAMRLDISSRTTGDRKLLVTQDLGACAPTVSAGRSYRVEAWYQAGAPPALVAYYRTDDGVWHYWVEGPRLAPRAEWTSAAWTTPPAPSGATGISVGMLLDHAGSLSIDDLSLTEAPNG